MNLCQVCSNNALWAKNGVSHVSPGTWSALNRFLYVSFKQNSGKRFRAPLGPLVSEAIMNSRFRQRLIVTHIRKSKRVHKLCQCSEVHKFSCVYLKIKPNQLSKHALYRKMMQYGIKLSLQHPSETKNNFENSYLKSIMFKLKIKLFIIVQLRL